MARNPVSPLTNLIDIFLPDVNNQPGVQGLVPAPPPGAAASGLVLSANGWAVSSAAVPGGANTTLQYNNNGVFGGVAGSSWDGTTLSLPVPLQLNGNAILTSPSAATLQLGAVDAVSPIAQIIQAQSVIAGTNNTAGMDWTFIASKSTGNALGGKFIWKTTSSGAAGSTQNTPFNTLVLDTTGTMTLSGGSGASLISGGSTNNLNFGGNGIYSAAIVENGGLGLVVAADRVIGWSANNASGTLLNSGDTFLTRKAAASIQFGNADAAAPIAQTISAQSVLAGTSNTAGADATYKGSAGTGTGAGGKIVFQTAPAGASGTAQNSYATALALTAPAVNQQPSCVLGNQAIATTATDGFLYLATCAGTPTGTPTSFTGRVPAVIDTTNSQLWLFLGGAWKQPKTPAGAALVTWQ